MLNNTYSIKFSELNTVRALMPNTTITDVFNLSKNGGTEDIIRCKTFFSEASEGDINALVKSRKFVRWLASNKKFIAAATLCVPAFSFALFKLHPGEFLRKVITYKEYGECVQVANTGTTVSTSFWGGKGAILLHMLVVGFVTLVVSSFMKFTGRGDLIPLIAFVGGGIILYEVIGLFNDIYTSIQTLFNM